MGAASQAQCVQRCGRAGREAPGKCFRLFPEAFFRELPAAALPEIQRSSLVAVVLQLKAIGVADVVGFDFLDPPPRDMLKAALNTLYALQATVSIDSLISQLVPMCTLVVHFAECMFPFEQLQACLNSMLLYRSRLQYAFLWLCVAMQVWFCF